MALDDDFPVGVFADDQAVTELPEVAAADGDAVAGCGGAGEEPLGGAAITGDPVAVFGVVDVGNTGEAAGESFADGGLADEAGAPGVRTARHFEDGVFGEVGHDGIDVVAVEGGEDLLKGFDGDWLGAYQGVLRQ
jgi:hypothetical protein